MLRAGNRIDLALLLTYNETNPRVSSVTQTDVSHLGFFLKCTISMSLYFNFLSFSAESRRRSQKTFVSARSLLRTARCKRYDKTLINVCRTYTDLRLQSSQIEPGPGFRRSRDGNLAGCV